MIKYQTRERTKEQVVM